MTLLAHAKALIPYVPSLATYGAAGGSLVLLFTSEWKGRDLMQFIPIYNRKYTNYKERDM